MREIVTVVGSTCVVQGTLECHLGQKQKHIFSGQALQSHEIKIVQCRAHRTERCPCPREECFVGFTLTNYMEQSPF
jgi:hypothetical protein